MKDPISSSDGELAKHDLVVEQFVNSYLIAIGQIVVSFNNLEKQMRGGVAQLISGDLGMTTRITAGESFMSLQRLLTALFRYRIDDKTQLKRLDDLNKALAESDVQRNNYIHSEWFIGKFFPLGEPFAQKYKASKNTLKNFKAERMYPRIEELGLLAVKLGELTKELSTLLLENSKRIKSHRKKNERNRFLPITNLQ